MSRPLFECPGGTVALPARTLVLVDRADGGNLLVNPPREVWERSELDVGELTRWACLVAATGRAMIDVLPALAGGCVNYWEAGNWALHDEAEPRGMKNPAEVRRVHLHLLGRSRTAMSDAWAWGEAPSFPRFADRHAWAASFSPLSAAECVAIIRRTVELLETKYDFASLDAVLTCESCRYPTPERDLTQGVCEECRSGS